MLVQPVPISGVAGRWGTAFVTEIKTFVWTSGRAAYFTVATKDIAISTSTAGVDAVITTALCRDAIGRDGGGNEEEKRVSHGLSVGRLSLGVTEGD